MADVNRNRLISRLHIAKKEQGLDDDLYRDKLEAITGKRSAADLTDDELERAVQGFRSAGDRMSANRLPATKQARIVQAMWLSLWNLGAVKDASDQAATAFIRRQTGLEAARWLKRHEDMVSVVEALKDWLVREGVDWENAPGMAPYMRLPTYRVAVAQWRKLHAAGAVTQGRTWTGNARSADEEVYRYAQGFSDIAGEPSQWTNPQWARVNKALGRKIRAALDAKEKAA